MADTVLQDRRILVVEDDYVIAQEVRRDLEDAGAIVVGPVPSVASALERLGSEPAIDAAVLDVTLGGENSFPIAHELETREIPFLFSTGYNSADIPAQWQHATIASKPLSIASVAQLLAAGRAA